MKCYEFVGAVDPYLDGELPVMQTLRMHGHIVFCEQCPRVMESEAALHSLLATDAQSDSPPAGLRERVLQQIAAKRSSSAAPRSRAWGRLWAGVAGAAIVGVLLLALTILVRDRPERVPPAAAELVAKHVLYAEGQPGSLEMTTSDPSRLTAWLEERLGFAVDLPRLAGPDERLVGGRVSSISDGPAAYLLFEWRGRRVSLFVGPPVPPEHLGGSEQVIDGVELRTATVHGVALVWWREQDEGRVYAAASRDAGHALVEFTLRCVQVAKTATH